MKQLKHVGIIPDGMRRWSASKNISLIKSYKSTYNLSEKIISFFFNNNVSILSVYALSSDNLKRDSLELLAIKKTLLFFINNYLYDICNKWGAKFIAVGNYKELDDNKLTNSIHKLEKNTKFNNKKKIYALINYDPFFEISKINRINKKQISLDDFFVKEPVDLLIRTGSVRRTSNFLPLQISYAELYFINKLFTETHLKDYQAALNYYYSVKRKFGK